MLVEEVPVDLIQVDVHRRRPIDRMVVAQLRESIEREGLLHPITVRMDGNKLRLVSGAHRFEAVLELGCNHIPVVIHDLSDEEAEVIELEENLVRNDLTTQQRNEQIRRLAELLKLGQNVPVSGKGGRGRLGLAMQLAQKLGLQKKTVQRALNGGQATFINKKVPDRKSKEVQQSLNEAPSATEMMDGALAIIRECWTDIGDGYRSDIKTTIAALPGGNCSATGPLISPWAIEEMARQIQEVDESTVSTH